MTTPIVLSAQQTEAVSWLMDHLCDGVPLVALRGLAGTGKTTLVPALRQGLEDMGIPVTLSAPTHRAAMVLKRKGQLDAQTVHSAALTSYFTPDYARAVQWLGESVPVKRDAALPMPDVQGIPWLIHDTLHGQTAKAQTLQRRAVQYGAKKALASIGISGKEHCAGFGPKVGQGCLMIDEASMVGRDMLAMCTQAFPLVCLIGDPGQLPPVKDGSCLAEVEGYDLSEIHRQAADSPIIQLAYAARQGQRFWERLPSVPGQLEAWRSVEAEAFLESPLIVWRNVTRLDCTRAIRAQLGYPPGALAIGEPLVCRSTDPSDRSEGMYNNALFRVVDVLSDGRSATIQEDCGDKTHEVYVHMEELHGTNIHTEAVPFRFGYCLTAHTAQGGEWPTVYISQPDLYAYAGFKDGTDLPCWAYTAITRAKQTLGFLTKHDFTRRIAVAVPSWPQGETMPRMTPTPTPETIAPPSAPLMQPGAPVPDDIPDPEVPPGVADVGTLQDMTPWEQAQAGVPLDDTRPGQATEATRMAQEPSAGTTPPAVAAAAARMLPEAMLPLAHGFCQYVQGLLGKQLDDAGVKMARSVDTTVTEMANFTKGVLASNEHASYSFADALVKFAQTSQETPYQVTLRATSQEGFPVELTMRKATAAELVDEMGRLVSWLTTNGYSSTSEAWRG